MNFNKKYMIFSLVVILLALVANYSFQQSYRQEGKSHRQRKSVYFGKNKIVTNLYLAQAKSPKFLDMVEEKLEKDMQGASKALMQKRLSSREWLIYAEALGLYSTDRSIKLMQKIYELGGIKTRNRIVKGLGDRVGKQNRWLLSELEKRLSQMNELEKVTFYLAKYRQLSRFDEKKYQKELQQIVTKLKVFLSFAHPMVNFSILRFFYEHKIFDTQVVKFSKQIIVNVLAGTRLSPVLLRYAAQVLLHSDLPFMKSKHQQLLTKPKPIFIRFYISTLRVGCLLDLPFLKSLLLDPKLSFSIFRPLVAELRFIGGDDVVQVLEEVAQKKLGAPKHKFMVKVLKLVKRGKSPICPRLL